jgi:nitronate monooxygenase
MPEADATVLPSIQPHVLVAFTGRVLRNRHAERWLGREAELAANAEEVARDYAAARERGDFDTAAVIAGEACGLIHDIAPAAEIVERVVAEAERIAHSAMSARGSG